MVHRPRMFQSREPCQQGWMYISEQTEPWFACVLRWILHCILL